METAQSPRREANEELALRAARVILEGFNNHYRIFRAASAAAKERFEAGDWPAVQTASRERIQFYDLRVQETVARLAFEFHAGSLDDAVWQQIKTLYIALLTRHQQPELAESFFNSVCCKILHRSYFHNNFIFVRPAVSTEHLDSEHPAYRSYYPHSLGLRQMLRRIIADVDLACPFTDLRRDLANILRCWRAHFPRPLRLQANFQIHVLSTLFYRNKGAYLVGRAINGDQEYPFVVPVLRAASGSLYLDTILLELSQIELVFSSNRAYFMVDMEVPSTYVQFLRSMLRSKPAWEVYTVLGLQKQGKTLFYRDFLHHLKYSSDEFIFAPGIKGLVMVVFTLPSYPYVFKVIKDVIAAPKETSRDKVMAKYLLVKQHDRVGRMADTLEYSDVAFPKDRFNPALLEELRTLAPSVVDEDGGTLIIKHLYIESRMIPLNMYLSQADEQQLAGALQEYGAALKQLAAANIFAGDLLFKNFGVTRHGRVVFYDYDEIDYVTNCHFRSIPAARTDEDELAAEPWYTVAANDMFPEEWAHFLLSDKRIGAHLLRLHPDLFKPEYWQSAQKRIASGYVEDVFPYPKEMRFCNRFPGAHGAA